jgi:Flp pilus assembly pilin Flp
MPNLVTAVAVRVHNAIHNLRDREEGQGLVEYVTLIALIALGLFIALIVFRNELGTIFSKITDKIEANLP